MIEYKIGITLFYSILQIFYSILFYSVFSILYSILSCKLSKIRIDVLIEYKVKSLYSEYIYGYCTINNFSLISYNDMDLRIGDLNLYVCLREVMKHHTEYAIPKID